MKNSILYLIVFISLLAQTAFGKTELDFTFHKLESNKAGNTLLVIGGVQGDEPGGFNAASLLVTHYTITKGTVWVIPNLNFISIINRSRGVYGDLNRKFAYISANDPEFESIKKVKAIILEPEVDVVLNLHDGSGFYRPIYIDQENNPMRWGQSIIIDQENIQSERFSDLSYIAKQVVDSVNKHLFSESHLFHVKNTKTRIGNLEMAKTLTYFAIKNLKPAFGVETSKSFPTYKRAYYHLRSLESFMNIFGIEFKRNFELSAKEICRAINEDVKLDLFNSKIMLDVRDARNWLRYVPLKKYSSLQFKSSSPLIAIMGYGDNTYKVYHGNRRVTNIHSQYFEYDSSIDSITMEIDGSEKNISFGEVVSVGNTFMVVPRKGFRVNVIGYKKRGEKNEAGISITKKDIIKRFSVDKRGRIYRVEVYHDNKFTGMILVNFEDKSGHLYSKKKKKPGPKNNGQLTGLLKKSLLIQGR